MTKNKILVTGSAGFIGYYLCKSLLEDDFEVIGIDNINDYYDINLKKTRLNKLLKKKNFVFEKIDISDRDSLSKLFKNFQPSIVVNLAAQVGVRYSIDNPYAYMSSNLNGFLNIIDICRENSVKDFLYASSSSVYGANKKIPFSELDKVEKPISFYAVTKRSNELIAYSYSHLYGINTIGLRFFTVYGPLGRPDMAYFIFTKNIIEGKPIRVYNNGLIKRDFTYIDDIINGIRLALNIDSNYSIFNLGNNNSIQLINLISLIEDKLNKKAVIQFQDYHHQFDVVETLANINYSIDKLNYKPSVSIDKGIQLFIEWYKSYYNY